MLLSRAASRPSRDDDTRRLFIGSRSGEGFYLIFLLSNLIVNLADILDIDDLHTHTHNRLLQEVDASSNSFILERRGKMYVEFWNALIELSSQPRLHLFFRLGFFMIDVIVIKRVKVNH